MPTVSYSGDRNQAYHPIPELHALQVNGLRTIEPVPRLAALLKKKPARLAIMALAKKLAGTIWAMVKTGESIRAKAFARA